MTYAFSKKRTASYIEGISQGRKPFVAFRVLVPSRAIGLRSSSKLANVESVEIDVGVVDVSRETPQPCWLPNKQSYWQGVAWRAW